MKKRLSITINQAQNLAEKQIRINNPDHPMTITKTDEQSGGWVFHYTTDAFLRSNNKNDLVPGNVPIMVSKDGLIGLWNKPPAV
jgi:hypothetical protein